MLTKTTISAIRSLIFLGLRQETDPVSPKRMAEHLGESPTYLAKVVRLLAKAGILRAHRGAAGGVLIHQPPEKITLLAITQACQGTILADLCTETPDLAGTCAFHRAGAELHRAVLEVMSRWTLADFLRNPYPTRRCELTVQCWMQPAVMRQLGQAALVSVDDSRAARRGERRTKRPARK